MASFLKFTPNADALRMIETEVTEAEAMLSAHKAEAASFLIQSDQVAVRNRGTPITVLQRRLHQ